MKNQMKWMLFPGLNLHARLRCSEMPRHFGRPQNGEQRTILDAGCGNGMLSHQAYLMGNRVVGVSIKSEVQRNRQLFNEMHGIPEERLQFLDHNLYDVESLGQTFDEIICCEVMEHIKGDEQVCRGFFNILKPGGVLHLCCPNAEHPHHVNYPLDPDERGGHVRSGYTAASYQSLLAPIGFEVSDPIGLGGPIRQTCNVCITRTQETLGKYAGVPVFLALAPWALLDGRNPKIPFSLYVQAKKPSSSPG
jgi:SAM-dependent methyltransferase